MAHSPAKDSGVTIRILNARLAAGAVSGGWVDQVYDGWRVVSQFEFQHRPFVHDAAFARIVIPLLPGARSLNVALAGAIALAEALRQTGGFAPG